MANSKYILFALLAMGLGFHACEEIEDPLFGDDHATVYLRLMDKTSEYEEVNIDIMVVGAIIDDSLHSMYTNAGIYNLLDYTGYKDTILASKQLPPGYLSQIRLILGSNNSIKVNGVSYDLKAPGASLSGLKLNVHEELWPGVEYSYLLDFDVEKSIVEAGKKYLLKPVIRVISESLSGTISGVVIPAEANPKVTAFSDQDTLYVYTDGNSGEYIFRGVPPNTYDLLFEPLDPYIDTILYGIEVGASKTVNLDTLFLN